MMDDKLGKDELPMLDGEILDPVRQKSGYSLSCLGFSQVYAGLPKWP